MNPIKKISGIAISILMTAITATSFMACSNATDASDFIDDVTSKKESAEKKAISDTVSAVTNNLFGRVYAAKASIGGAFANQYSLLFKDKVDSNGVPLPTPVTFEVHNQCDTLASCTLKRVMVKSWIDGFSDTASITDYVEPDSTAYLVPIMSFNEKAMLAINAPMQALIQVRAYALENDREILFHSSSKITTIHPMSLYGEDFSDEEERANWTALWVTPNMDSITAIHGELTAKLPTVSSYELFDGDTSLVQSTARVVKAVYEVISERGISYVSNVDAGTGGQKIKYPVEVLRTRQANCIEITMLMASILESMGIHAIIVTTEEHAFLGWFSDDEMSSFDFLEATLSLKENLETFESARVQGLTEFIMESSEGNFDNETSFIVNIDELRKYGIMPNNIP